MATEHNPRPGKLTFVVSNKITNCSSILLGWANTGYRLNKQHVLPYARKGAAYVGNEIKKINKEQKWSKRCGTTLIDNSIGLCVAMLASKIVENTVEVEQFSNLWGLLASRPVVSEDTFQALSFSVEFLITLLVFTLTEHYISEFRQRKSLSENDNADDSTSVTP